MKSQFKKLACFALCVCMLLSVLTVNAFAGTEATAYYEKVTTTPADWSGDYLIVYEAKGYVFNSGLANPEVSGNHFPVTITNGKIEANATTNAAKVTIAKSGNGYSIKMASGKYVGHTGSKNTLNYGTSPYVHTLSYTGGNVKAACGDYFLLFNSNTGSGNNRFRYYKSNQQPIQLYKYVEPVVEEPEQEPNTAVLEGNIITVKADEGYELKAGALVVTDANGKKFVPERVGYREGGDASKYKIPDEAVAPYTKPADADLFYQPTAEDLNMDLLGCSVTDNQGGGLRFVHRLNITQEGGKLYMLKDGVKAEVAEYGMLFAVQAILNNPEDLDIETAEDSMHVHQFKWPESNKYYDTCKEYVDIAAHITGITTANGGNMNIITRIYVKFANDDAVYYEDVVVDNFNAAKSR